ncbi:PREDICTED: PR domain zinc finger protein 1-like, partial [Priapulus caudatus]|uniref:PR domain zinc finger protein 1-like n=1 Tax=Priapulus caudatus TaxID=37621 RepID=A0ABM1F765_PRICU
VYNGTELYHYIDGFDTNRSNWMRYVNPAHSLASQNLIACQYKLDIYFYSVRPIPANTELLVWYCREFAERLNYPLTGEQMVDKLKENVYPGEDQEQVVPRRQPSSQLLPASYQSTSGQPSSDAYYSAGYGGATYRPSGDDCALDLSKKADDARQVAPPLRPTPHYAVRRFDGEPAAQGEPPEKRARTEPPPLPAGAGTVAPPPGGARSPTSATHGYVNLKKDIIGKLNGRFAQPPTPPR